MKKKFIAVAVLGLALGLVGTSHAQPGGLVISSGVQSSETLPVGFYGKLVRGYLPVDNNKYGVRIFEIQVTGPFEFHRINNTAKLVAFNLNKSDETLNDKNAITTGSDATRHTVIGCIDVTTNQVSWVAFTAKGQSACWEMSSQRPTPEVHNDRTGIGVKIGPRMLLKLVGADDDHGQIAVGHAREDTSSDWDSPRMSR